MVVIVLDIDYFYKASKKVRKYVAKLPLADQQKVTIALEKIVDWLHFEGHPDKKSFRDKFVNTYPGRCHVAAFLILQVASHPAP